MYYFFQTIEHDRVNELKQKFLRGLQSNNNFSIIINYLEGLPKTDPNDRDHWVTLKQRLQTILSSKSLFFTIDGITCSNQGEYFLNIRALHLAIFKVNNYELYVPEIPNPFNRQPKKTEKTEMIEMTEISSPGYDTTPSKVSFG